VTPIQDPRARLQRAERVIARIRAAVIAFNVVSYLTLADGEPTAWALTICAASSVYAAATLVWQPGTNSVISGAFATMAIDNILIAIWLLATGGFDSPYYPLFYAEAAASVGRFGTRWGGISALGSALLYVGVALVGPTFDAYHLAVRSAYVFVIAVFVAYIFEEARASERDVAKAEEEARAFAELDRMRSTFVTNISHELRTPLTAIRGAAATIWQRGPDLEPDQRQLLLEMIDRQSEHLSGLVQDIIDVGLEDQGALLVMLQMENLGMVVSSEVERARSRGASVVLDAPGTPVRAQCDARKVGNAVRKLLDNAIKFSEKGSEIRVRLSEDETDVWVAVTDKGCGIAPDTVDRVFDRFYQVDPSHTRSADGTGVGLSIVRTIMNLHGGEVSVDSDPGTGSTFTLRFPKKVVRSELSLTDSPSSEVPSKAMTHPAR
jgi:signal transduction histidine kinase